MYQKYMKKALRDANTARAGCSKVRTPSARPPSLTHRQDRLQYPQLASAQCNKGSTAAINRRNCTEITSEGHRLTPVQRWLLCGPLHSPLDQ